MRKYLISFATPQFKDKQNSLNDSANDKGFTDIISYSQLDLGDEFVKDFGNILDYPRGYGCWSWKSFIIKKTLDLCDDGDIILYLDSSNLILENLDFLFEKCFLDEIVLFENRDGSPDNKPWTNKPWTKRDCYTLMNCDDSDYWNGKQVNATYQLYKKSSTALKFVEEFYNASRNINIISDLDNITLENFPEFMDHRHDQSILSLLAIKYNITLLPDPSNSGNLDNNRKFPQLFNHCR